MNLRDVLPVAAGALALAISSQGAQSQSFPTQPLRIVVPLAPGGPIDLLARAVAENMSASLKQPVVVENKPGAGGNLGAESVAKSAPDGHTLLAALGTTLTVNPHVYPKMPIDMLKDLRPVANMASTSQMLVVHPSVPANSLSEFIALAKNEHDELRACRARKPRSLGDGIFPTQDRSAGDDAGAVSRQRSARYRSARRSDQGRLRGDRGCDPACARRPSQGLCGLLQGAITACSGYSNGCGIRVSRLQLPDLFHLARTVRRARRHSCRCWSAMRVRRWPTTICARNLPIRTLSFWRKVRPRRRR